MPFQWGTSNAHVSTCAECLPKSGRRKHGSKGDQLKDFCPSRVVWWVTHNLKEGPKVVLVSLSKSTSAMNPRDIFRNRPSISNIFNCRTTTPAVRFPPASSDKTWLSSNPYYQANTSSEAPCFSSWDWLTMFTQLATKNIRSRFLYGNPIMCPWICYLIDDMSVLRGGSGAAYAQAVSKVSHVGLGKATRTFLTVNDHH